MCFKAELYPLTEHSSTGEWYCILTWLHLHHFCDIATLGSASNRLAFPDLAALSLYPSILAIYDSDPAGDVARSYLSQNPHVQIIAPPAHDLTDYWRSSGNLQSWLAARLRPVRCSLTA